MKKLKRILFITLIAFIIMNERVNASVASSVCSKTIIEEGEITTGDWSLQGLICEWSHVGWGGSTGQYATVAEAITYSQEKVYVESETVDSDGKTSYSSKGYVVRCSVGNRKWTVSVSGSSTFTVPKHCCGDEGYTKDTNDDGINDSGYYCNQYCNTDTLDYSDSTSDGLEESGSSDLSGKVNLQKKIMEQKCKKDLCNGKKNCTISGCLATASYACRVVQCKPVEKTVKYCTRSYTSGSNPAYCVNSDIGFGKKTGYRLNTDFDPSVCKNSNTNANCGYANILIESAYRANHCSAGEDCSIYSNEKVIELALRIWAARIGESGYNSRIGVAYACNAEGGYGYTPFLSVGEGNENTYKVTNRTLIEYLISGKFDSIYDNKIDTDKITSDFVRVACKDSDKTFGHMCYNGGSDTDNYWYAIILVLNTINGNSKMLEHYTELAGETTTTPQSVSYNKDESGNLESITVQYDDETPKTITCSDLTSTQIDELKKKGNTYCTKEQTVTSTIKKEKVTFKCTEYANKSDSQLEAWEKEINDKYCKDVYNCTNVDELKGEQKTLAETYCPKVTIQWKDKDGKPIEGTGYLSYCHKNACTFETKENPPVINCSVKDTTTINNFTVKVFYKSEKRKTVIKEYIPCGGENKYQKMFVYDKSEETSEKSETDEFTTKQFDVEINCDNCEEESYVKYYDEDGDTTVSSEVDNKAYCAPKTSDGSITSSLTEKDPSLSCIVSGTESMRSLHDFSSYFGVNTDVCRIYCSDELEYYLDRTQVVQAGRELIFDIGDKFGFSKYSQSFTTVVKEKRYCVSEIYYNNGYNGDKISSLALKYGLTEEQIKTAMEELKIEKLDTWIELYRIIQKYNPRDEVLIELVYDLYNCNLVTDSKMKTLSRTSSNYAKIPKDKVNIVSKINELYGASNNYGLNGNNCESGKCIEADVGYEQSSKYASDSGKSTTYVGDIKDKYNKNIELKTEYESNNTIDVKYCKDNDASGFYCFKYCSGKASDASDSYCSKITSTEERLESNYNYKNSEKSYSSGTINYYSGQINIPTNDYAWFEIETTFAAYNSSKYKTQAYTGDIYDYSYAKSKNKTSLPLSDYSYPVNKNAYSIAKSNANNKVSSYKYDSENDAYTVPFKINYKYVIPYYRIDSQNNLMISKNNTKEINCTYGVTAPETTTCTDPTCNNLVFRNVDLSNMFPNSDTRATGSNWTTSEAVNYRKSVENEVNSNGLVSYYNSHLTASYVLTTETIKDIQENTDENYTDVTVKIYGNDENNNDIKACSTKNGIFENCKSSFLEEIEKRHTGFNQTDEVTK